MKRLLQGPACRKYPGDSPTQARVHLRSRTGELTLGKAVPRVDVAVVDIHDVHALVTHEVPLVSIALRGVHGSHSQAGAWGKAKTPNHTPGNVPTCPSGGSRGPVWGSGMLLGLYQLWSRGEQRGGARHPSHHRALTWWASRSMMVALEIPSTRSNRNCPGGKGRGEDHTGQRMQPLRGSQGMEVGGHLHWRLVGGPQAEPAHAQESHVAPEKPVCVFR